LCGETRRRVGDGTDLAVHSSDAKDGSVSTRIYVGNLSFDTTEEDLAQAFGEGSRKVQSVSIVTDRDTGRPRGFAFVEMANEADARAAIAALDGTELGGRTLKVNEAQERGSRGTSPRGNRPGGDRQRR
jgi:RNA recognition motif-containing protein